MSAEPRPSIDDLVGIEFEWTERQRQVLDLIARGRSNPEIAAALGISLDGAKWHMREILSKLGVESREEAAEYWRRRNGWHSRLSRAFRGTHWFTAGRVATVGLGASALVTATAAVGIFLALGSEGRPSASSADVREQSPSSLDAADDVVSQAVNAVEESDWARFLELLDSTDIPCSSGDVTQLPRCGGAAAGELVPSIVRFQCGQAWVSLLDLADESSSTPLRDGYYLRGVVDGGPSVAAAGRSRSPVAWALFANNAPDQPALAVALGTTGVLGFGLSCGPSEEFFDSYLDAGNGWLVPPGG